MRPFNIIAVLLSGFLLAVSHATLAQGLDEATSLNQQAIHLYGRGRYSEAIPVAQRALAVQEKELVPIILMSLHRSISSPCFTARKNATPMRSL